MTNQDELTLARTGAWEENEIRRLENMVASGFTNELIAKALGRKLQAVATRVHYLKKRQADRMAMSRRMWTVDQVVTLETMLKDGASTKDIGRALQRSEGAVREYLRRLRAGQAAPVAKAPQQIFTTPMPQPPEIKPITLTPAQRAWSKQEPQTHRNAAWAAVAVAVGLAGFILGGLAQ
jgi:DNA-binding CsgD family transcriptional regulator